MADKMRHADITKGLREGNPEIVSRFGQKTTCQACSLEFYCLKRCPPRPNKYCSRSCYRTHIKNDPRATANWKGGSHVNNRGYVETYAGGLYDGNSHAAKLEHVRIGEKILGRPLKKKRFGAVESEIVHHINGDKWDNRHCNLLICTQSYHRWLHSQMSLLYQREHFDRIPRA